MVGTNSQLVKDWRVRTKERMVKSMGGCCQICGYKKSNRALEFHHIDPSKKEYAFGDIRSSIKGWKIISEELKKCILLCSNCHKEVEDGLTILPDQYAKYDSSIEEEIEAYRKEKRVQNIKNIRR